MFWHFPDKYSDNTAFIEESKRHSYQAIQEKVEQAAALLPVSGNLVFLFCKNDLNTMVFYLACLQNRVAMMLLDANLANDKVAKLAAAYSPAGLIRDGEVKCTEIAQSIVDPRLAILLSTSGSTGTAKQVALSYDNLQANAESICHYLPILKTDTTITTLPCHYSYGLSVINTHLLSGASCLLTDCSVMSPDFWHHLKNDGVNSFAGVPYTYEMLMKLRFQQKQFPDLRYITQAGGRLAQDILLLFANWMDEQGKAFYVMYGQTEATARMAWLAPDKLARKPTSIGQAIPSGHLSLVNEVGEPISQGEGELVYQGPNVMLGYASHRDELQHFLPVEQLRTGDLAKHDEEGDFYIVGRLKRFVKVFGLRIGLDDVETQLEAAGYEAKVSGVDDKLFVATTTSSGTEEVKTWLSKALKLHHSAITVIKVERFPTNSNHKTDYRALNALFEVRD